MVTIISRHTSQSNLLKLAEMVNGQLVSDHTIFLDKITTDDILKAFKATIEHELIESVIGKDLEVIKSISEQMDAHRYNLLSNHLEEIVNANKIIDIDGLINFRGFAYISTLRLIIMNTVMADTPVSFVGKDTLKKLFSDTDSSLYFRFVEGTFMVSVVSDTRLEQSHELSMLFADFVEESLERMPIDKFIESLHHICENDIYVASDDPEDPIICMVRETFDPIKIFEIGIDEYPW